MEINIELHTKLFANEKNFIWDYEKSKHFNFYKLNIEHNFIHLAGHLAFQHTFLKLYWLFDIYFYLKKYQNAMNWKKVHTESIRLNLNQSVTMCLWAIYKYFNLEFNNEAMSLFQIKKFKLWKKILTLNFLIRPQANLFQYILIKHLTKDHLIRGFLYDLRWIHHYLIKKNLQLNK